MIKLYWKTQGKTEVNGEISHAKTQHFKDVNLIITQLNSILTLYNPKRLIFHRTWNIKYIIKILHINEEKIVY